jgi:hypothetical protein
VVSFWVSYYLKVRRIRSIHETLVAMFAGQSRPFLRLAFPSSTDLVLSRTDVGMCVGAIVRMAPGHVVQSMIAFKSTILLNVLLPPIILNSGYQLKQVSAHYPTSTVHVRGYRAKNSFLYPRTGKLLSKFRSNLDFRFRGNVHLGRRTRVRLSTQLSPPVDSQLTRRIDPAE